MCEHARIITTSILPKPNKKGKQTNNKALRKLHKQQEFSGQKIDTQGKNRRRGNSVDYEIRESHVRKHAECRGAYQYQ